MERLELWPCILKWNKNFRIIKRHVSSAKKHMANQHRISIGAISIFGENKKPKVNAPNRLSSQVIAAALNNSGVLKPRQER